MISLTKYLGAAAASMFIVSAAGATTLSIEQITSNTGLDASSQIQVTVSDAGAGANFNIQAIAGTLTSFSIAEIYWSDTGGLFAPPVTEVASSAGVNINEGSAAPPELPGANTATPAFVTTSMLLADAPGANANAIQIGEFYTAQIGYDTGVTFADVIADILDGSLRMGFHVRSHNGGGSESYVSNGCIPGTPDCDPGTTSKVPVPAGLPLLLSALGIGAYIRKRG